MPATRRLDAGCPVIVGAGLAGLSAAIELSPAPCIVLNAGAVSTGTSTGWAQGGIAAAVGPDDTPAQHAADTIAAGAGLCREPVVEQITTAGPDAITWLAGHGARFDTGPDGSLRLGLEGAHGRRRIVHAQGDRTGAELLRTVVDAAHRLTSVAIWQHSPATDLLTQDGSIAGVRISTPTGPLDLMTDTVVLATGGIGGLYRHTTNPLGARGQGLGLAYRAGARLRDLEFVQFHPTALDITADPMPLVSEAVRGEGAILVNEHGEWVLRDPLSARDVVSRAEWAQLLEGHRVFLDAREQPGERFADLFPSIHATALAAGLDPRRDLLPVRPAAHYHMGGVEVDDRGRASVPGLYAAGEVASTGLHGANRLASNSLLEAVVCGRAIGRGLLDATASRRPPARASHPTWATGGRAAAADPAVDEVRRITSEAAGVLRTADGLRVALDELARYRHTEAGLVAWLVAWSALQRQESRGAHTRLDHPATDPAATHTSLAAGAVLTGASA